MDALDKQIAEDVQRVAKTVIGAKVVIYTGIARGVDVTRGVCGVALSSGNDENDITPDMLMNVSLENADGMYLVPEENAKVIVAELDEPGKYVILRCSKLKAVYIRTAHDFIARMGNDDNTGIFMSTAGTSVKGVGNQMRVDYDGVHLINDNFGGIPKAGDVARKLKILENKLTAIFTDINTGIGTGAFAGAPGGAALAAVIKTAIGAALFNTTAASISNPKVQHGS